MGKLWFFVAEAIAGIPELIERGEKLMWGNFASMTDSDFPNAYSDDGLVWVHHVNSILPKIGQSPIANWIAQGLQSDLPGEEE
jgi:hypothetical protein